MDDYTVNDFDENGNLIGIGINVESKNNNESSVVSDDDVNIVVNIGTDDGDGDQEKVTICHDGNTIEVSPEALEAHYGHGDTIGPCPEPVTDSRDPTEEPSEVNGAVVDALESAVDTESE